MGAEVEIPSVDTGVPPRRRRSRLIESFRRRGVGATLRLVWKNLIYPLRIYWERRFDRKLGIETAGRVELDTLVIDSENKRYGVLYEPTPVRTFNCIVKSLPIEPADYTFVDYGAGKGRVVIAADMLGFGKAIGVEFSPQLCAVAASNVQSYRSRTGGGASIEIRCMDAVAFDIPDVPCVLYFFNPFERPLLERIAGNIAASLVRNRRRMYVVHYNPVNTDLFSALGLFRRINAADTAFELVGPRRRRFVCYESLDCAAA